MTNGGFMALGGGEDTCEGGFMGGMFGGGMSKNSMLFTLVIVLLILLAYTIYVNYKAVYDLVPEDKRPAYQTMFWKVKSATVDPNASGSSGSSGSSSVP